MTTRTLRAAAACALLATTCLVTPAMAQTASTAPAFKNVDDNGVDLTTGAFNFSLVEGSIGSGVGSLSMVRYWAGNGWLDNWQSIYMDLSVSGSTTTVTVILADRSEIFTSSGSAFTAAQGNGATLTGGGGSYTYRDARGGTIAFGVPDGVQDQGGGSTLCNATAQSSCKLVALSASEPNGATTSFSWDVHTSCSRVFNEDGSLDCQYFWRLAGVANNSGYAMAIAYQAGGIINGQASPAWFERASVTFSNTALPGGPTPTVTYAYPASNVTEITTPGGRTWRFTTGSGGLVAIRRPGVSADSTTIAYGANGVSSVTADGETTSYSRTVGGATATTTVTDALSHQRTVVSDLSKGRPTSVTDELNRTTSYGYDGNARLTSITAPEGNQILSVYDARGNVTQTTAKAKSGSGAPDIVTTAGYDASCGNELTCNQPTWTRDAAGNQTDFVYDGTTGNVASITSPAAVSAVRPQTRYTYSNVGGISMLTGTSTCQLAASCANTADEARTTIAYGANNLPSSVATGAGNGSLTATQTASYTPLGDVETVDGPLPGAADTTRARYNASRELVGVVGPDPDGAGPLKPRAVRTTINGEGQVVAQETGTVTDQSDAAWSALQSLEQVNAAFDANGRLVKRTLSAGGQTHAAVEYSYDAEGRPECTAQRMNPASFGALTNACTLGTAGSFGPDRVTRTVYDAADQITQTRVAVGTGDEAAEVTSSYTPNGKLGGLTDGENNRTDYAYDGFDRLKRTIYPVAQKGANASNPSDYEELGYDIRSLVTSRRLRDGQVIGLGYDDLGRPVLKNLPGSEPDVTYGHDLLGRLTSAATPAHALSFTYDALGRRLSETGPLGTIGSSYDLAGRRTRLTHRDGFFVDHDYLTTGEMSAIRENGAASGQGVLATFAYDDLGRRTGLTRGNGTTTSYAYDFASRLSQLTHDLAGADKDLQLGFAYSPASQIVSQTRSNDAYSWTGHGSGTTASAVNGLNQLTQAGAAALTYDARGNITSDGSHAYGYSSENLLTSRTVPGLTMLSYDPLMRFYDAYSNSYDLTQFQHDGDQIIAEIYQGRYAGRYVHGPGVDEPLVSLDRYGNRKWLHADERGSVVAISDASGAVVGVNKHDEFGVTAGNFGRFQYTGQARLTIDLLYYKARVYDPKLGRFLQTDPISYWGGMNLYAYVGGDPVNLVDPSGLREICWNVDASVTDWVNGHVVQSKRVCGEFDDRQRGARVYGGGGPAGRQPEPQKDHKYKVDVNVRCSAGQAFRAYLAARSAPGASAPASGQTERNVQLFGGDWIMQTIDYSNRTILNETVQGRHRFDPGTVFIRFTPINGGANISIIGRGTGNNEFQNRAAFEAFFRSGAYAEKVRCAVMGDGG